jgi:phosphohistidine phosphatase SixA
MSKPLEDLRANLELHEGYVFLMRHAKHGEGRVGGEARQLQSIASSLQELATAICSSGHEGVSTQQVSDNIVKAAGDKDKLSQEGSKDTEDVMKTVKRHIQETKENIAFGGIICAKSVPSEETAKVALKYLGLTEFQLRYCEHLGPDIPIGSKETAARKVSQEIYSGFCDLRAKNEGDYQTGNAVLVVGHQPILGWISKTLSAESYPIANSEVLCFQLTPPFNWNRWQSRASLLWVVSPSDDKTIEDLREKVRSKMEIAKLLSAFIAAGLGFVVSSLFDAAKVKYLGRFVPVAEVGAVLLFIALLLYLTTMCSYDTLLMPRRFWSESSVASDSRPSWIVARPPSSALWILYQNMLHIWTWQFIPATYFLLVGFLFMGSAIFARITSHFPKSLALALSIPAGLAAFAFCFRLLRAAPAVRAGWPKFKKCPWRAKFRFLFGP